MGGGSGFGGGHDPGRRGQIRELEDPDRSTVSGSMGSVHSEAGVCCRQRGFVRPFRAEQQFGSPMAWGLGCSLLPAQPAGPGQLPPLPRRFSFGLASAGGLWAQLSLASVPLAEDNWFVCSHTQPTRFGESGIGGSLPGEKEEGVGGTEQ